MVLNSALSDTDGVAGQEIVGVLQGNIWKHYGCDKFMQPADRSSHSNASIVAQCNISQHLQWLMARTKVRPAVLVAPSTKVAPTPHLEWALEALQRVRSASEGS